MLLSRQDTPGALISATDVQRLALIDVNIEPILDILRAADFLDDDRPSSLVAWLDRQLTDVDLPSQMLNEIRVWFDVLHQGSSTAPRSRPRNPGTVRLRIRSALPILRMWAEAGHTSLREISREQVIAALPPGGSPRSLIGQALRSLFTVLKGRKMVFANPLRQISTGRPEDREPVPLDSLAILRDALACDNPLRAMLAALVGFHALRNNELRGLHLTDIRDGRLHIGERTILLAEPVRHRLTAWLNHRSARWANTQNPHLIVNTYTAVRIGQVSAPYIIQALGISPQAIREDRILSEAHASGGDVRRLLDMFGLSVKGATRYTDTVDHPGVRDLG